MISNDLKENEEALLSANEPSFRSSSLVAGVLLAGNTASHNVFLQPRHQAYCVQFSRQQCMAGASYGEVILASRRQQEICRPAHSLSYTMVTHSVVVKD